MSYQGISIKEALERININWFLPAIQRPYVWGNRYESEKYICKLFDSLFQKYPIGGLIMWETDSNVAHREFISDFHQGDPNHLVDEGLWSRNKCLIYDGQQRLQTLYSCLRYTFNNRVLVFNLAYDPIKDEDCDTGFRFIDKNEKPGDFDIKMNFVFSIPSDSSKKAEIRRQYSNKTQSEEVQIRIETNLDELWNVFVGRDCKSLAYFSIASSDEKKVNEIFERLNTGGIPLSKADLLFSRIKHPYPEFEFDIINFSKQLVNRTKISFESYDILQLLHLIVKRRSRVDENVTDKEIEQFNDSWNKLKEPLSAFWDNYLVAHFHISHSSIIRNKMPVLVLMSFFYRYYCAGKKFKDLSADELKKIDRFFITAEINDWTLQSYTDNFVRIIFDNKDVTVFPYDRLEQYVYAKGNRAIPITEAMFRGYRWMALKVLMPNREFEIDYSMPNRFNPELDHIFPLHLSGTDEAYRSEVDIVWNMQPVKGEVNNLKLNHHPQLFFTDKATRSDGSTIQGSKYFSDYDFVPEINDVSWENHSDFISKRKKAMIHFLYEKYDIMLVPDKTETKTENTDN